MRLYHYSKSHYDTLMTLRARGATQTEVKESEAKAKRFNSAGPYIDHISFFFDPIPSRIMGRVYGGTHEFWHEGNEIFEHVIETDMLDRQLIFDVVESPRRDKFFEAFTKDHEWKSDDPELLRQYLIELNNEKRKWGEIGVGIPKLNAQIKLFSGGTERAILKVSRDPDFEWFKNKYAANVPHLMVYPSGGIITVHSVSSLVIGNANRKKA